MKLRIVKVTRGLVHFYIVQRKWLCFWITYKQSYPPKTVAQYGSLEEAKQIFNYLASRTNKEIVHKNY